MKKILSLLLILTMLVALLSACNQPGGDSDETTPQDSSTPHVAPKYSEMDFSEVAYIDRVSLSSEPTDYVLLDVADYGKILIRLYPDVAPETVANFKMLVSENFYDGLIFHRVIQNFMIQGGDPSGDGTGGSPDTIKGEFTNNGFENNLKHMRGVVSMARLGNDMDSASSQFFICHQNTSSLNGDYAAFGFVVYGMDTVDKIAKVQTNSNDKPLSDVVITSARFATVPTDAFKTPAVPYSQIDFSKIHRIDVVTDATEATDYVKLTIEGYGDVIIRLYADVAPETVANFKKLVSEGFYDGLTFHRVVEEFMIQGGDPNGDGTGGSPDTIKGEFSNNGFENNLKHIRGVVSMARLGNDMNSASSQFFICQRDVSAWNGNYAAFGFVVYGMSVVDAIAGVSVDNNKKPLSDVVITSASFVNVPAEAFEQIADE